MLLGQGGPITGVLGAPKLHPAAGHDHCSLQGTLLGTPQPLWASDQGPGTPPDISAWLRACTAVQDGSKRRPAVDSAVQSPLAVQDILMSSPALPPVCRPLKALCLQSVVEIHKPWLKSMPLDVQGLECTDLSLTYQTIMCLLWQEPWCPRGSANCVFPKCNLNKTLAARLQASWSPRALSSCMGPRGASSHPLDGSMIPRSGGSLITGQGTHLLKQHRPTHNQHSLWPTPTFTLSWVRSLA